MTPVILYGLLMDELSFYFLIIPLERGISFLSFLSLYLFLLFQFLFWLNVRQSIWQSLETNYSIKGIKAPAVLLGTESKTVLAKGEFLSVRPNIHRYYLLMRPLWYFLWKQLSSTPTTFEFSPRRSPSYNSR